MMQTFDVALFEKAMAVSVLIDMEMDGNPIHLHTGARSLEWDGTTYEGLNCFIHPEYSDAKYLALKISDLPFGAIDSIPQRMTKHSFIRFSLAVLNADKEIAREPDVLMLGYVEDFKPLSNSEVFMLIRLEDAIERPIHADSIDHTGHQTQDITTTSSPCQELYCLTCGVVFRSAH